jgi:tRNA(Ile)-lysidine synthase
MDLADVQHTLLTECALEPGRPLIAGVSGGPDSLCLLDILQRLGYAPVVAHFDHQLRPDSGQDARRVALIAQNYGLPFVLGSLDVAGFARRHKLSIEEAARIARYRFLFETARQRSVQAVAVAHTADDQVETVVMHLLRGAGLSGLKGMAYRSEMPGWDPGMGGPVALVRPLLGTWRTQIMEYCQEHQLEPTHDPSNADLTFFRNRLRHELIPTLGQYNPRVKEALWRMAQVLAGDQAVLEDVTRQAWASCLSGQGAGYVMLSLDRLRGLSLGLQRGVLRTAIDCLRPDLRDIDFAAVERAVGWVSQPPHTGQADLVSGLNLYFENERLFIMESKAILAEDDWPLTNGGIEQVLSIPGNLPLENGWAITCEEVEFDGWEGLSVLKSSPYHAWLDSSALTPPLQVRTARPGERFEPLGMGGHSMKLSDFFINQGLPRRARPNWPLVCSGEQVAWVCGYRPAHPFRVCETTQSVVHLHLHKI